MQEWLMDKSQPEIGLKPDGTSMERPENSCAVTLPIQPDRAWEDLQRRMGEAPLIQVCHACSVITCNHCQMCFNKVLSKGSEHVCTFQFEMFYTFAKNIKPVFSSSG
jgi:hypothetical protein